MASLLVIEKMVVQLVGDATSYIKMLFDAQSATGKAMKSISDMASNIEEVGKVFFSLGKIFKDVMGGMEFKGPIESYKQFEHAIRVGTSIFNLQGNQFERMKDLSIELSKVSSRTASEIASVYSELGSAGFNAEQSMAALPAILKFASAGQMQLSQAVTLSADALFALRMNSNDAAENMKNLIRIQDVLTKANQLSNGSIEQFSRALTTKAAASMKSLGIELEDGVAVLAAFAAQGIKSRNAGNLFTRLLTLMSKSAQKFKEMQEAFGFSFFDEATGKVRPLVDVIKNIEEVTSGMSAEAKTAALSMLGFEARIQGAVLPLEGTSDMIREFTKELKGSSGEVDKVSGKITKSLQSSTARLTNQITALAIQFGEHLRPAIDSIGDTVAVIIKWFDSLDKGTKNTILTILSLISALVILKGVITAVALAFKLLGGATALGSLTLLAGGITAAAVAVISFYRIISSATESLTGFNNQLRLSAELAKNLQDIETTRNQKTLTNISALGADPEAMRDAAQKELEQVNKLIEGRKRLVKEADETVNGKDGIVESTKHFFENIGKFTFSPGTLKAEKAALDEAKKNLSSAEDLAKALKSIIDSVGKPKEQQNQNDIAGRLKVAMAELRGAEAALSQDINNIGLSKEEIKKRELAMKGLNDSQMANYIGLMRMKQAAEDLKKAQDEAKGIVKTLEEQVENYGLTENEIKLNKIAMSGLTAEFNKAAEAINFLEDMDSLTEWLNKGEELTNKYRPALEQFNDVVDELNNYLETGVIDQDTYNRALEDANKQFFGASKAVEKYNSALAGSADAISRITDYREKLADMLDKPMKFIADGTFKANANVAAPNVAVNPAPVNNPNVNVQVAASDPKKFNEVVIKILQDIADNTKNQGKPTNLNILGLS